MTSRDSSQFANQNTQTNSPVATAASNSPAASSGSSSAATAASSSPAATSGVHTAPAAAVAKAAAAASSPSISTSASSSKGASASAEAGPQKRTKGSGKSQRQDPDTRPGWSQGFNEEKRIESEQQATKGPGWPGSSFEMKPANRDRGQWRDQTGWQSERSAQSSGGCKCAPGGLGSSGHAHLGIVNARAVPRSPIRRCNRALCVHRLNGRFGWVSAAE